MLSLTSRKFQSLIIAPALLPLILLIGSRVSDNHPPEAADDSYVIHGCAIPLQPGITANDSDPDGDQLFIDAFPQLSIHGSVSRGAANSVSYCPNYGYLGADSFTYEICDNQGACDTGSVNLNVVNQAPIGGEDSYNVHGTTVIGPFLVNDSDSDGDALSCGDVSHECILTFPQHGGLTGVGNQADRKFYGPTYGYTGPDSFTYNACDSLGLCTPTIVHLSVNNSAPIAGADSYVVRPGTFIGPFLVNDSDADGDSFEMGGPFQESIVTFPEHGQLIGVVQPDVKSYNPNPGFSGSDSFTYAICDDLGQCSTAKVTLYVPGDGENNGVCVPCNGSVGGPVNVTNGNMYLQQTDYALPGIVSPLNITRTFNSNSQRSGLFGIGWSSQYDESIVTYDHNLARLNQPDGRAIYFGRPADSSSPYSPLEGDFRGQLTQAGGFTLSKKDGSVDQFDSSGRLLSSIDRNHNQTTFGYDSSGKLISVTDPFGRVLVVTTNTDGQIISISDAVGLIATYTYGGRNELLTVTYIDNSAFQFAYDGNLRLTTVTDALGNVIESHSYDGQGRALTSEKQNGVEHYGLTYVSDTETDVTDALGRVTRYTFDQSRGRNVVTRFEGLCSCGGGGSQVQTWTFDHQLNLTSETDALGHSTSYTYDANGNRLSETDAAGTVTYTYNSFGEALTRTNQLNGVTSNTYGASGNLLTTTNALGKTTTLTYDARGLLLTVTDARGKVTRFTYDATGNLITRTDALSHDTHFGYDARARLTSTTNAVGHTTAFAYDGLGRLTQVTQADGTTIGYEYDPAGRRTALTDAKGNRWSYAYDTAYRLISQTDAANQTIGYTYDAMSNLTSVTDALSRVTNYDYDEFNRLIKTTYPPATSAAARLSETITYDADGNITQRADAAGRVTRYAYDDINRIISVTDPDNKTTNLEYDALSRMTALVDAIGQRYRFNYDAVGQLRHLRRGTDAKRFAYDPVGNRKTRTDYNGAVTNYAYDALNRLKTITYPDTTTVNYTYDKLSRLQTATNENGTINFDYNKMNRLTSTTDVFGQVVDYNYDADGNCTKLSLNTAVLTTYRYDALNRLTKLLDSSSAAFTFDYDATNKITQQKAPNGVKTSFQYDGMDRLTRLLDTKGVATLADRQYQYNTASQITQVTEPTITRSYVYDVRDRLTSASYTNPAQPNESYSYDSIGNRTSTNLSGSYAYQPFNRLTNTSTATYTYDVNGNLTSATGSSGTTQYSWDFENRPKQVTLPSGKIITYKYDALGRRIQRVPSTGVSTNFVYDGQNVIRDLNSDGSTVDYLSGPGIDNKLRLTDSRLGATGPIYFLQDQLGSTTKLTNSLGVVVNQVTYDSFGNSTGSSFTRYDYTGRERDADTGLIYYRARWYDPQVGRFISEDPVGFDGGDVNLYAYVTNNPLNSTDPSGQWSTAAHNEIIEQAFRRCLNESQRQKLKDASAYVDRPENQDESHAYQHGMRGGPGESEERARTNARIFIEAHEGSARSLAPLGCKEGYDKISADALWEIGQALHTIMDMTSPSHENFQIWYGPPYPTGILPIDQYRYARWGLFARKHQVRESLDALRGDPARLEMVKKRVREEFAKVFGDCGCCRD